MVAALLLVFCLAGIVFLCARMKGKERKAGYIMAIVGLACLAAIAAGYCLLTLLFLESIL